MARIFRAVSCLALLLSLLGATPSARAAYHLWQMTEVFSNADGSVQFIEMFDCCNFENFVNGQTLQAVSDGVTKTFIFPGDIPSEKPTGGKYMLIATPGFAALSGGVTPDFTLPDPAINGPFFNPNATNVAITFFGSFSSISGNATTPIPKDGIQSLMKSSSGVLSTGVNSPTNVDGGAGSVNLATPSPTGDYNGNHVVDAADYAIWRHTLGQAVAKGQGADGNANSTIDAGDYDFWKSRFGNNAPGAAAGIGAVAVPEPVGPVLLIGWLMLAACARCRGPFNTRDS